MTHSTSRQEGLSVRLLFSDTSPHCEHNRSGLLLASQSIGLASHVMISET